MQTYIVTLNITVFNSSNIKNVHFSTHYNKSIYYLISNNITLLEIANYRSNNNKIKNIPKQTPHNMFCISFFVLEQIKEATRNPRFGTQAYIFAA